MKHIDRWIQVVTAVAVLFGLGLVVWELQQVRTLTRAQLTSENVAINNEIYTSMLGEHAAQVVAKACLAPEELTLTESIVLNDYYLAHANLLARLALISDRDEVYAPGYWRENFYYLNPILKSLYGRMWLLEKTDGWPPGFVDAVRERISELGPPTCATELQERIERIQRHGGGDNA